MATAESIIGVQDFQMKVCEALGLDPGRVARIIIDLKADNYGPVPVYVEMIADKRILSLDWGKGLTGAEIVREPKDEVTDLLRTLRTTNVKMFCPECDWEGTTYDCEPDVGGDGNLRCPDCHTVVEEWKDLG